ncbi:phosphatidate cytidylyltransferase [Verrucosispora sp. WMMA2121]|uniref:phosphatidate cytidylyltransferase n=1 Tax=Verrucosispora sp. WMMA2121 TaxID=3015164 RepID=UPI0022B73C4B|nr:phosphatidate cytidylyltransferase [Verrucosispora sp. WMMA2121]MCZ7420377.1 phosphatidate cytidylyltransferase [Verrucosispora sp. WMMA2121]
MAHLDPYGGAEARDWDRPDRPTSLPWPDPDVEPGPWGRGRYGGDRPAPENRNGRGPGGWDQPPNGHGAPRDLDHGDAPTAQIAPVRVGAGRDHDEAPTTQLTPVREHDDAPPTQLAAVPPGNADLGTPEPDGTDGPGRRHRGRRRAGAGRPATQQGASRAGRNLPAAISVGVCLGAAVLLPLFLYTPAFLLVLVAAFGVGIWEMSRAVRRGGAEVPLVPLVAGGVLTVTLAWFAGLDALLLGLLVTVAGTLVWRLGDGTANLRRDMTAATLISVYVPFLGGFAALLASSPGDGALRVLVTLVAVVLSDTGGYAAGANFGKRPMAPTISPKKSWEGFAGSVGAAALGSAVLLWLLFDVAPWWGAVFGVAVSGAAVLGDLAESMIKRDLGVKDMSNLLPGHGGLMDRLDSVLFAVPTAYLLLVVFVPAVN